MTFELLLLRRRPLSRDLKELKEPAKCTSGGSIPGKGTASAESLSLFHVFRKQQGDQRGCSGREGKKPGRFGPGGHSSYRHLQAIVKSSVFILEE